ncbi:hypothetical protein F5B20DRAFT_38540 [Whalleya microplaca]|nr:hypothetical protein F5B20DRAFT_38540 [Whalleya microplaca]
MCADSFKESFIPLSGPTSQDELSPLTTGSPTVQYSQQLAITVDMGDNAYSQSGVAQIRNTLSGESSLPEGRQSIATPSTSAYSQDIPITYASVAPFNSNNYSVPYDSSLPTPVSVAGSPSISERSSKAMQSYNQRRESSQQPTPPGTSRTWQNYQMNAPCSQSTSPMPLHATPNDMLEMHGLETSNSPEDQGQMISEPQFQWGQYGVSSTEAQDDMSPHMAHHPSVFSVSVPSVAPTDLMRQSMTMNPSSMPLAPAPPQVPILHHSPDPRDLPPSVTPIDNMHHQYGVMLNNSHVTVDFAPYNKRKPSRARNGRSGRPAKRARVGNRNPSKDGGLDYLNMPQNSTTGGDSKASRPQTRSITLTDEAKEADRYLLDLRCQMDEGKGKGMWDHISKKYEERFGYKERPTLQMQLTRALLKYAVWPPSEDEALKRAVEELDKRRYSDIAKLMKEYGGCQAWEWKDGHIVKRLVELGIEEFDPKDITKKPRRNKNAARKQSTGGPWAASSMPFAYQDPAHTVTSEQEDLILEQYCKAEPDTPEPNPIITENNNSQSRRSHERGSGESQSERVAKQACEQLLAKRSDQIYGNLPMGNEHHHHHQM